MAARKSKPDANPRSDLLVVYRDPKDLIPYGRNARTHSAEQIEQIKGSILEFGFTNPVLLKDDERTLGAGHARTLAALALGLERIPTITLPGLTAAQWRAQSHCRFLHGYALSVRFAFEADELDVRNWVVDFGSLKSLKGQIETTFDHKTLVAADDPKIAEFKMMHRAEIIDMVEVPATGCEKFAEMIFGAAEVWLTDNRYAPRVRLAEVEVSEHGANSAIVRRIA